MIKAILACDDEFGIARAGVMPWPPNMSDLAHFKKTTTGATVVMGRKTWEAEDMPSPLPGRKNVVVTGSTAFTAPGATVITQDIQASVLKLAETETVFVIGGASLFHQLLPVIDEIILTRILGDYNCDTRINQSSFDDFRLDDCRQLDRDVRVEYWHRRSISV